MAAHGCPAEYIHLDENDESSDSDTNNGLDKAIDNDYYSSTEDDESGVDEMGA